MPASIRSSARSPIRSQQQFVPSPASNKTNSNAAAVQGVPMCVEPEATPMLDAVAASGQGADEATLADAIAAEEEARERDALLREELDRQAAEEEEAEARRGAAAEQDARQAARLEREAGGGAPDANDGRSVWDGVEARGHAAAGLDRSEGGTGTQGNGGSMARYASILPRAVGTAKLADPVAAGSTPWAKAAKPLGFGMGVWNSYEGLRRMSDDEEHYGDGALQAAQGFSGMFGPWVPPAGAFSLGVGLGRDGDKKTGASSTIANAAHDVNDYLGGGTLGALGAGTTLTLGSIAAVPAVAGAGLYQLGEDGVNLAGDAVDLAGDGLDYVGSAFGL